MKIYCDTNRFPVLQLCGSHPKNHGARGLVNHYHICFDPNLGHCIPCECVACTSMIDQPWISGVQSKKIGTLPTCHQFYLLASSGNI